MDEIISAFEETQPAKQPKKDQPAHSSKASEFARTTAEYFQAFLDGRISTSPVPVRSSNGFFVDGLPITLDTARYPQLHKNLYKNLVNGFTQKTFVITQNKYSAHVDESAVLTFEKHIGNLQDEQLAALAEQLAQAIAASCICEDMPKDAFLFKAAQHLRQTTKSKLVMPLLQDGTAKASEKPLVTKRLQQATDCFASIFDIAVGNAAAEYYDVSQSLGQLTKQLAQVLSSDAVKSALLTYAESMRTSDAYRHIYVLQRTGQAVDTSLYVYFCTLQLEGALFPLFYAPVAAKHTYPAVTLTFGSSITINNEALAYCARLYALRTGRQLELPELPGEINTEDADTAGQLQAVADAVISAFAMQGTLTVSQSNNSSATNGIVSLSNSLQFFAASSGNRAARSQYDAILDDPGNVASLSELLEKLIIAPPVRYVEEIAESWDSKPLIDKLLPSNPLGTNDEQRQVMLALEKKDCDVVVVDGASGTGKSYLAASIALEWLGNNGKVLIASSSEHTASSVAEHITKSVQPNKLRAYSPVLDLGRAEKNLEQLDDQSVATMESWLSDYTAKQSELTKAKKRKLQDAKETLTNLVQNAENINLQEVEQTIQNEKRFAGKNWIHDEPIDTISDDIQKLHRAMQYVRSSEANYLLPYVAVSQQQAISQFIGIFREYEKTSKHVSSRLPEFIVRYRKLLPDQKDQLHTNLAYIQSNYRQFIKILKSNQASQWMGITDNTSFEELEGHETIQQKLLAITESAEQLLKKGERDQAFILKELDGYKALPEDITAALNNYIDQVATLKSKLFGFSGRTLVVENLNKQLTKALPTFSINEPEKDTELLALMSQLVQHVTEELAAAGLAVSYWKDVIHLMQTDKEAKAEVSQIMQSLIAPIRYDFMAQFRLHETDNLLANIALLHYATELNRVFREQPSFGKLFGISAIGKVLARPSDFTGRITKLSGDLHEASQLDEAKQTIKQFIKTYPDASRRLGITMAAGNLEVIEDSFALSDPEYIKEYLAHKMKEQDIRSYFDEVTTDNFSALLQDIKEILALELQYKFSEQAVDFLTSENKVSQLSDLLTRKQLLDGGFCKETLAAFPCVAGSSTRIAESLPLESGLFDIAIVENAGSLSVADILPLLLRAKKLLIIGNDNEIPSSLRLSVSGQLNGLYRHEISRAIRKQLEELPADQKNTIITKVEKTFDAQQSGLEFCRTYANYEKTLTKQYGTTPEIAMFANKYFYGEGLQLLSSRARPLTGVFIFESAKLAEGEASYRTNEAEVRSIIEDLLRMKETDFQGTIGIITPFAEQAALLQKELDECVITDWFERRDVVVRTFDTCSDIKRDYVFYSMVVSENHDWLDQVLPPELPALVNNISLANKRLLAGINSARTSMHFVISKPISSFSGAVKQMLEFYQVKLNTLSTKAKPGNTSDILLPAENDLAAAYHNTSFAEKHEQSAHFIANYQFADYLKAFSKSYQKPAYKVYFLVSLSDTPIVIEYDDLKEKFLQSDKSGKDGAYLSEQDVYGQKVMESYGYHFLRLNKYNLGSNASGMLDKHLSHAIRKSSWAADNGFTVEY
ncbi:MAG: AAA domain-containing protein [Candidatus Saccharimonadales bacterium]